MSAVGHSLPGDAPPAGAACPLRSEADKSAGIALSPLRAKTGLVASRIFAVDPLPPFFDFDRSVVFAADKIFIDMFVSTHRVEDRPRKVLDHSIRNSADAFLYI